MKSKFFFAAICVVYCAVLYTSVSKQAVGQQRRVERLQTFDLTNETIAGFTPTIVKYNEAKNQYFLWDASSSQYLVLDAKLLTPIFRGKSTFPITGVETNTDGRFLLFNESTKKLQIVRVDRHVVTDTTLILEFTPLVITTSPQNTWTILGKNEKLYTLEAKHNVITEIGKTSKIRQKELFKQKTDAKTFSGQLALSPPPALVPRPGQNFSPFINAQDDLTINRIYPNSFKQVVKKSFELLPMPKEAVTNPAANRKFETALNELDNKYRACNDQVIDPILQWSATMVYDKNLRSQDVLLIDHKCLKFEAIKSFPTAVDHITVECKNSRATFWSNAGKAIYITDLRVLREQNFSSEKMITSIPLQNLTKITLGNIFTHFAIDSRNNWIYAFDQTQGMLVKFRKTDFHREAQVAFDFMVEKLLFDFANNRIISIGRPLSGNHVAQLFSLDLRTNKQKRIAMLNVSNPVQAMTLDADGRTLVYTDASQNGIYAFDLVNHQTRIVNQSGGVYTQIFPDMTTGQIAGMRTENQNNRLDFFSLDGRLTRSVELTRGTIINMLYNVSGAAFYYALNDQKGAHIFVLDRNYRSTEIYIKKQSQVLDIAFDAKLNTAVVLLKNLDQGKQTQNFVVPIALNHPNSSAQEFKLSSDFVRMNFDSNRGEIAVTNIYGSKAAILVYKTLGGQRIEVAPQVQVTVARVLNRNLTAEAYPARVNLHWQKATPDGSFYIHRSEHHDSGFVYLTKTPIKTDSYVDFLAERNHTYYYLLSDTQAIVGRPAPNGIIKVSTPPPYHLNLWLNKEVIFFQENSSGQGFVDLDVIFPTRPDTQRVRLRTGIFSDAALSKRAINSGITVGEGIPTGDLLQSAKYRIGVNYLADDRVARGDTTYYLAMFAETQGIASQKAVAVLKVFIVDKKYFSRINGNTVVAAITDGIKYPRLGYPTKIYGKIFGKELAGSNFDLEATSDTEETFSTTKLRIGNHNEFFTLVNFKTADTWSVKIRNLSNLNLVGPTLKRPVMVLPTRILTYRDSYDTSEGRIDQLGVLVTPQPDALTTISVSIRQMGGVVQNSLGTTNEYGAFSTFISPANSKFYSSSIRIGTPDNFGADITDMGILSDKPAFVFLFNSGYHPLSNIWLQGGEKSLYYSMNLTMRCLYSFFNGHNINPEEMYFFDFDESQNPEYVSDYTATRPARWSSLTDAIRELNYAISGLASETSTSEDEIRSKTYVFMVLNLLYDPDGNYRLGVANGSSDELFDRTVLREKLEGLGRTKGTLVVLVGNNLNNLHQNVVGDSEDVANLSKQALNRAVLYIPKAGNIDAAGLTTFDNPIRNQLVQLFKQLAGKGYTLGSVLRELDPSNSLFLYQGKDELKSSFGIAEFSSAALVNEPYILPNSFDMKLPPSDQPTASVEELSVILCAPMIDESVTPIGVRVLVRQQNDILKEVNMVRDENYDRTRAASDLSRWKYNNLPIIARGQNQILVTAYANVDCEPRFSPTTWFTTVERRDLPVWSVNTTDGDIMFSDSYADLNITGTTNERNATITVEFNGSSYLATIGAMFSEPTGWNWQAIIPSPASGFAAGAEVIVTIEPQGEKVISRNYKLRDTNSL